MARRYCLKKKVTSLLWRQVNGRLDLNLKVYDIMIKIPCLLLMLRLQGQLRLALDSVMVYIAGAINKQIELPYC